MKKTAQSLIFFLTLAFLLFSFARLALADSLIRPIPEEYPILNSQFSILNSSVPSITFGDLLAGTSSAVQKSLTDKENQDDFSTRAQAIKNLLAQFEVSYQESLNNFQSNNQQLTINNNLESAPFPTPYIPIPTLVAGVSEIISNQNSAIGNQPSGDNRQQITDNRLLTTNLGVFSENPIKTTYTIAFLGDSMVDTLGKDLPHLKELLKQAYPNYSFTLLNYGQGGTDLASGLYRLTQATNYLGTDYPPLLSSKPDILVVESFAYNHWSGHFYDLDRQWLTIAKIIDVVKENSPETKIILAATIAPNALTFGDGVLNWQSDKKWESATITRTYLQNLVNFATSQNYPLADAYHPSLGPDGNGLLQYINQGDHLHPSNEGALLFSQKVIETIKKHNLIP